MEKPTRVALYGNSLFIAGLAASLKGVLGLEVIQVNPDSRNARQRLEELESRVIAFDITEAPPDLALSLLRERSELLLLALDPADNKLLVLSGQQARTLTMQDLVQVITQNDPSPQV